MTPPARHHGHAWDQQAACSGVDTALFVPDGLETEHGLGQARAWCDTCPVRQPCLMTAVVQRRVGYWGGTNTYQRAQLARVRTRAKCPLCQAVELVVADAHELCLACGASWVRDVRLTPLAATPLPAGAA